MIVLDLCCSQDHRFEGWFASADAFEEQCARQLVSCPVCGSSTVRRLPSAPYVQTRHAAPADETASGQPAKPAAAPPASGSSPRPPAAAVEQVLQMLQHMSRNAEDVGERLPEEARRIHYGEAEVRDIRGQASAEDVEELLDEGIMVLPLPALPGDDELH